MASLHRARVCAVGSEEDMCRLLGIMLDNLGYGDLPQDRPPYSLSELRALVTKYTHQDGAESDGFLYEMLGDKRYGDAESGTCRLTFQEHPCGLWTALFSYDSAHAFQAHEWLILHRRCDRMLMVAQRASEDFGAEKGEIIFTGGAILENWDAMVECWMWLIAQYGCGYPPEENAEQLKKLRRILQEEEYDISVDELLLSCMNNLTALAMDVQDSEGLRTAMEAALQRRDFDRLLEYRHAVAEAVLWETDHNAKWLANLQTLREVWERTGANDR